MAVFYPFVIRKSNPNSMTLKTWNKTAFYQNLCAVADTKHRFPFPRFYLDLFYNGIQRSDNAGPGTILVGEPANNDIPV